MEETDNESWESSRHRTRSSSEDDAEAHSLGRPSEGPSDGLIAGVLLAKQEEDDEAVQEAEEQSVAEEEKEEDRSVEEKLAEREDSRSLSSKMELMPTRVTDAPLSFVLPGEHSKPTHDTMKY